MTDAKKASVDLAALDVAAASDKPFSLELLHPVSRDPLGAFVSIYGKESGVFRDHTRRRANDRLRKAFERRRRGKAEEAPTIEELEAEAIDMMTACIAGWSGLQLDGAAFEFSPANVKVLLSRFPWVREQLDDAIGDIENFMPG